MSFCEEVVVNCDECYEASYEDCSAITVTTTNLVAGTNYHLFGEGNFQKKYNHTVTISGSKSFTVNPAAFPEGFFSSVSGKKEIWLSTTVDGDYDVPLTISGTSYNCVIVTMTTAASECCDNQPFVCSTLCEQIDDASAQAIVDCIEDAGKTAAVEALICTGCDDATVNVNSTLYDTVAAGGTLNIPVKNSAATNVGTVNAGVSVVIGDSAVTDGDGTVNQVPATVSFSCQPHITVAFTADVTEATAGSTLVTFSGVTTNATSWLWNFGDGNTSTLEDPTHTYTLSGDYTVTLTAFNANSSGAFTRTAYIHVYQSESIALLARFTGTPTDARKRIIDNFVVSMKAANYWSNTVALWVLAAHDSQASQRNWITNDNNLTYVNSPTFTTDRGITSNGTTSYAQTGWIPSTDGGTQYTLNDNYICVYIGTNVALTAGDIGVLNVASTNGTTIISRNTGTDNYMTRNNAATQTNTAGATDSRGFIMLTRTASASYNLYKNGVFVANIATASQALASLELYICTINNNGAVGTFSTRRIQYVAAGKGVGIDPLHYYNIVQTYMTAIGANV